MAYYSKFKTLPRVVVDIQRCLLIMLTKNYGNTSERDVKAKENYLTRLIKKKKNYQYVSLQCPWAYGKYSITRHLNRWKKSYEMI